MVVEKGGGREGGSIGGEVARHTTRAVAGLVVLGEVAEVEVLDPGDPGLVLLVVLFFGPLHFCCCLKVSCGWVLVVKVVFRYAGNLVRELE